MTALASIAEHVARWLTDTLAPLPDWAVVAIIAMLPVAELRASIPVGLLWFKMHWLPVLAVSVLFNVLVVPAIWAVLPVAERILRKIGFMDRFLTWLFEHTRRRTRKRVETYQEMGLFLFVAIPLPGTGAWTGALVAYLFDLPRRKSLWVISAAVLAAGIAVTLLVQAGAGIFARWGS